MPIPPELEGRTILVVDDDRLNVRVLREELGREPYEFLEAFDGAGALTAARDGKPDLVLMDVEMPGLGGVEVCRILKGNQGQFGFVPVILMTARGPSGKVEGLELGADDYLVKPIEPAELRARVKSMLRLKVANDRLHEANKQLAELNERLQELSQHDALTGLHNRYFFDQRIEHEWARAERYSAPLAVLMMDIDHFKRCNDEHGHPFGDLVLRGVAQALKRCLRNVDTLARYGGEEMVALLPETPRPEGAVAAERLRKAVEAERFESGGKRVPVTVSVGVAFYPEARVGTPHDFLKLADEALYRAKQSGRNRVCVHGD